tara:strand:- start:158 stop:472 length:315 start_codon:yes stop_codon:yes gene_type:complete
MSLSDKELTELLIKTYGFKGAYTQGEIDAVLESLEWEPPSPILEAATRDVLREHYHQVREDKRQSTGKAMRDGLFLGCGILLAGPVGLILLILFAQFLRLFGYK